jgi:hypothetical protein
MKLLDISPVIRSIMGLVLLRGRAGKTLSRVHRPPRSKMLHPTNDPLPQFEFVTCRVLREETVGSQHSVKPGKINGLLSDRQGWLVRATGCTMQRRPPTPRPRENKTVPTYHRSKAIARCFSSSSRTAVCL